MLLVGRLVYEKGFHLALDALSEVIEQRRRRALPDRRLGHRRGRPQGPGRRLKLEGHGTFLGWIGDDILHSLYRIADLCVVPSIYEPFGLVALEAMASGCPCIVADTGGPARGRSARPGRAALPRADSGALARMPRRALTDEALRDRLVEEAAQHIRSFDWSDVARQTAAVYAELVRDRVT